jgi:L-rhamnose mutarotase
MLYYDREHELRLESARTELKLHEDKVTDRKRYIGNIRTNIDREEERLDKFWENLNKKAEENPEKYGPLRQTIITAIKDQKYPDPKTNKWAIEARDQLQTLAGIEQNILKFKGDLADAETQLKVFQGSKHWKQQRALLTDLEGEEVYKTVDITDEMKLARTLANQGVLHQEAQSVNGAFVKENFPHMREVVRQSCLEHYSNHNTIANFYKYAEHNADRSLASVDRKKLTKEFSKTVKGAQSAAEKFQKKWDKLEERAERLLKEGKDTTAVDAKRQEMVEEYEKDFKGRNPHLRVVTSDDKRTAFGQNGADATEPDVQKFPQFYLESNPDNAVRSSVPVDMKR